MPRFSSNSTVWIAILAVALVLRIAAGTWWQARLGERQFFFGDSDGYWYLARAVAQGEPYAYRTPDARVFRTPGYPVVLSSEFLLYGHDPPVAAARLLSAVLGTAAVGVAGWWTTMLFDARAGRFAGWIAALYPGSVALGVFVLSESPFCPLMLAHLAAWSAACRATTGARAAAWATSAGIAAAAAVYMRPSWLLFAPFALAVGLMLAADRARQLAIGAVMIGVMCLGLLPWWIRNAQVTGHFVPTTLQVGASLYDGLHGGATGASDMQFVPEVAARQRAAEPVGDDTFEYRLDRRMFREAVAWAQSHPAASRSWWRSSSRMWNVWPNEAAFRGWPVRIAMLVSYLPLLVLGIVGVWRYSAWGMPYLLAWLPAVYLTLLHVVFVSSVRYREPAMLALVVLAAGVLAAARRGSDKVEPLQATC